MDSNPHPSLAIGAFLVTYLIHSTVWIGAALLLLRLRRFRAPARDLLCKLALIGGVVTSLIRCALPLPHYGASLFLTNGPPSRRSAELEVTTRRLPIASSDATIEVVERPSNPVAVEEPHVDPYERRLRFWRWVAGIWLVGCAFTACRLAVQWARLARLRRASRSVGTGDLFEAARTLAQRFDLRRTPRLYLTTAAVGPMAFGVFRPCVVVPQRFFERLDRSAAIALLAHELAHVARRDPLWNLLARLTTGIFFFQPLNLVVRRHLRFTAELLADRRATESACGRLDLARCLTDLGEWLSGESSSRRATAPSLSLGMAAYRSTLGQRVEAILDESAPARSRSAGAFGVVLALTMTTSLVIAGPRASVESNLQSPPKGKDAEMNQTLTLVALSAALAGPVDAAQKKGAADDAKAGAKKGAIDRVPKGARGINGFLVGRLVDKDIEKGTFVVTIDRVKHLWRGNKAKNPKSVLEKTLLVEGVAGRWLDVLLVVKPGETIEFEVNHQAGDNLRFIAEGFRKVDPVKAEQRTIIESDESAGVKAGLPKGMRGFSGLLVGRVVAKDFEAGTFRATIERVKKVWRGNKAKDPRSSLGKTLTVDGVVGKWLDVLLVVKPGDTIEFEAKHNAGAGLTFLGETLKKVEPVKAEHRTVIEADESVGATKAFPKGMRGFSGLLIGRVVGKDVEAGTFRVTIDRVKNVWPGNKAKDPKSSLGKTLPVNRVFGKWLDVLLVVKPGDTIEFEAKHNAGAGLTFLGETLKKVEPVKKTKDR